MGRVLFLVFAQLLSVVLGTPINKLIYRQSYDYDKTLQRHTPKMTHIHYHLQLNAPTNIAGSRALGNENQLIDDFDQSSMLAFLPVRSCHVQLKDKYGVFSPPIYYRNINVNLWCNWTILAAPGKHIVVYITGFQVNADCDKNRDEIIFEGVSSTVENTVVYACWNKYTHVFATQATAVHIVFLWRSFSHIGSKTYFEGKYYVFNEPTYQLNVDPQNCSIASHDSKKTESRNTSMVSTILLNKTTEKPSMSVSLFPHTLMSKERSKVTLLSSIYKEDLSGTHSEEEQYSLTNTHLLTSSTYSKYEISTKVTHDFLADNGKSTLPLISFDSSAKIMFKTPTYLFESSEVNYMNNITETLRDFGPSTMQQEETITSFWVWQKDLSHWLSETPPLGYGHILESTRHEDLGKNIHFQQISVLNHQEDTSSEVTLESSLKAFTTESIFTILSPDQRHREVHSQSPFYSYESGQVPQENSKMPIFVSSSTNHEEPVSTFMWLWQTVYPSLYSETPHLDDDHALQSVSYTNFTKTATPLWVTHDQSSMSENIMETLSSQSDNHSVLPLFISSIEEYSPTTSYVKTSSTTMFSKAKSIIDDLRASNNFTSFIVESSKSLELTDRDIIPSEFNFFNSKATTTNVLSQSLHLFDKYSSKEESLMPQTILSLPSTYGTLSDPQILPKTTDSENATPFTAHHPLTYTMNDIKEPLSLMFTQIQSVNPKSKNITHHNASGDSQLGVSLRDIMPQFETLSITSSLQHVKLEYTPHNTSAVKIKLAQYLVTPSESDVSFNKHLEDISQTKNSTNPLTPFVPQSTTEWSTGPAILDNARAGIVEELKSTYSYQSYSDTDDLLLHAGQPNGVFFDDMDTISTFVNKTNLKFLHAPGDFLYAIKTEIVYSEITSNNQESDLFESVREKINENMGYLPRQAVFLVPQEIKLSTVNHAILTFSLHLMQGGRELANFLKTQLKALANSPLGKWNATIVSISLEDVNECQIGIQQCHNRAHCVNEAGTYSCICMNGYEDNFPAAPGTVCVNSQFSGIRFFYDHVEILIGSIVCVVVILLILIIALCVVQQKRHGKGNFSLEESVRKTSEVLSRSSLTPQSDSNPYQEQSTRHTSPRSAAGQHTECEVSSTLELTRITIEQTAC